MSTSPPSWACLILLIVRNLGLSVFNFASYLRNVQFHRVPFLTTQLLAVLIPKMWKLEVLGIYKCQLINVGDTLRLLEIIRTRSSVKKNQISFDFFPNYHVGPPEEPGNPYSVGSYGVTWDNWDNDTCLSVWCLVSKILPQAREQGIDFESQHTAFRQWLEMSPCREIGETIKALGTLQNPHPSLPAIAAMIDYRNTMGYPSGLCRPNKPNGWNWYTSCLSNPPQAANSLQGNHQTHLQHMQREATGSIF